MEMSEKTPEKVKAAWKSLLEGVQALGWRVARQRDQQATYTTQSGRTGTVTLGTTAAGKAWRFTVDVHTLRTGGRSGSRAPVKPKGWGAVAGNELSCAADEVPALAAWLPSWLSAYDTGADLPACPVEIEHTARARRGAFTSSSCDRWAGGYAWTPAGWLARAIAPERATR